MADPIISVENLGKRYRIHHQRPAGYRTLRDTVAGGFSRLLNAKTENRKPNSSDEDFWALKDVSFEVKQGEVLGVIGRNGAGKSTLLKILSRITEPTAGRITLRGRVASLLEVGTGFHPELTGRENIYLNGAILGMSKAEIRRKFDEIVAFAEVEKFLDTPVKHYSSGMYVRLAFAVAAHLEPEILVVDEVLAVGDAEFQKKCIGKMEDVAGQGRTVLFVSHNMGMVARLCQKCILLNQGRVAMTGSADEVLGQYLVAGAVGDGRRIWEPPADPAPGPRVEVHSLQLVNADGQVASHFGMRSGFTVEVEYTIHGEMPRIRVALRVSTSDETVAFTSSDSAHPSYDAKPSMPGRYVSKCHVPGDLLNEGRYSLTLSLDVPFKNVLFVEYAALSFCIEQTGGVNSRFAEKWPGVVCPYLEWETNSGGQCLMSRRSSGAETI